jgi:hypothetical protein
MMEAAPARSRTLVRTTTTSRKDDWLTFMSNSSLNQLANEHMNDVLSLAKF